MTIDLEYVHIAEEMYTHFNLAKKLQKWRRKKKLALLCKSKTRRDEMLFSKTKPCPSISIMSSIRPFLS